MPPPNEQSPGPGVPLHAAIIMDGNGRWATKRGLPRIKGHEAGIGNLNDIVDAFSERGVRYLTLFAFSTENWQRPPDEVEGLFLLLARAIEHQSERLHESGVRLLHIGRIDRLAPELAEAIRTVVAMTAANTGITLGVAFDYGGRDDILEAARSLIRDGVPADQVTDETFRTRLLTGGLPDPDLIIRTGGEIRISNFLLWQSAYAEFYSTPTLWPDFDRAEVDRAFHAYATRTRRFGTVETEG